MGAIQLLYQILRHHPKLSKGYDFLVIVLENIRQNKTHDMQTSKIEQVTFKPVFKITICKSDKSFGMFLSLIYHAVCEQISTIASLVTASHLIGRIVHHKIDNFFTECQKIWIIKKLYSRSEEEAVGNLPYILSPS